MQALRLLIETAVTANRYDETVRIYVKHFCESVPVRDLVANKDPNAFRTYMRELHTFVKSAI